MPFERYISHHASSTADPGGYTHDEYSQPHIPYSHSPTFSNNVQFQVPQLMLGPTLAPGGGAEVLPAGMIANNSALAQSWFINSSRNPSSTIYQSQLNHTSHFPPTHYSPSPYFSPTQNIHPSKQSPPLYHSPSPSYSFPFQPTHKPSSHLPSRNAPIPVHLPTPLGLPVYSSSGFDILSILSRVSSRLHPKIVLGPVDMSCSFVVVDKRRFDSPIVYASPTFCKLTGYSEEEVIGTNCRFLQAPHGRVQKGDPRKYTAQDAVAHLRSSLSADKECQASMINYRKGGAAFINLITVIPISGGVYNTPEEADQIVYHVGFQVDLTEQPNAILQKLRDGTYAVNYSNTTGMNPSAGPSPAPASRDWRINSASMSGASKQIKNLLSNPSFMNSLPISTSSTTLPPSPVSHERNDVYDGNKLLHLLLLESAPDFLHVVSLKGAFLYVAPSVRRVLGYEPEELVGKSMTDFCHPADVVPLMRELKESSSTPHDIASTSTPLPQTPISVPSCVPPKTVDLLFRMHAKDRGPSGTDYVWLECRGRLHVEPGKGRKAIILSGRVRSLPVLDWNTIFRSLLPPISAPTTQSGSEREFWALLSTMGTFLFVGSAVKAVLGWGAGEVIGQSIYDFLDESSPNSSAVASKASLQASISMTFLDEFTEARRLECLLRKKDGRPEMSVHMEIVFFHPSGSIPPILSDSASSPQPPPKPLVCCFRRLDGSSTSCLSAAMATSHQTKLSSSDDVFEELAAKRGSSWQYELQQLKIANQRLMEELEDLEGSFEEHPRSSRASHLAQSNARRLSYDLGIGKTEWNVGFPVSQTHSIASLPLKRSWDASSGNGEGETN